MKSGIVLGKDKMKHPNKKIGEWNKWLDYYEALIRKLTKKRRCGKTIPVDINTL